MEPTSETIQESAAVEDFQLAGRIQELRWAAARLLFHAYLGFSLFSVVGGFLTAPLITWSVFNDWRFWRYSRDLGRLYLHGWKMVGYIISGKNGGFMLDVSLTAPPYSAPPSHAARLRTDWKSGSSCGDCDSCCKKLDCPVLHESGLCRGYDSFFWRYFN
ncbi:MAG: hypothetical protein OEZ59_14255, partial [Deltaproteobacteria bacterium]|nr:hypothetical protein [Deltaproteobacteria bacterium]